MKTKSTIFSIFLFLFGITTLSISAQVPNANFSISPNPICTGQLVQITDLSTGLPSAWSYTILSQGFGPFPGQSIFFSVQNPTLIFPNQGNYTVSLVSTNSNGSSSIYQKTITVLPSPNVNITPANINTCIGSSPNTISIIAGGFGGGGVNVYNWSNGSTSQSISVSPAITTVYTCIVTATNGCSTIRTATVNIGNPIVTINSIPANICPGVSSTLTGICQGQGPYSYTWSNNSNTSTITSSVVGIFSLSITNNAGCTGTQTYNLISSATLSLTATSSQSIICAGNNATLSVVGASNYTWNTGANSANIVVNPNSNSSYTVVGSLSTCSGTAVLLLNVNVSPTINIIASSTNICAANSVSLTGSGASSYTWSPGFSNSSTLVVNPTTNTTYTLRGSNPACPITNKTVTITVKPTPFLIISPSSTVLCIGEPVSLFVSGANTYIWFNNSTNANLIFSPSNSGAYSVIGTNTAGCSSVKSISLSVNECTQIQASNLMDEIINVYPNPTNNQVNIYSEKAVTLKLHALTGELLKVIQIEPGINNQLETTSLANGLYLLSCEIKNKIYHKQLIVFH